MLRRQIPSSKLQIPTTPKCLIPNNSQTPKSQACLGFGLWEWLGFGAWSLGFDLIHLVEPQPLYSPVHRRLRRPRLRDADELRAHRREGDYGGRPLALALGDRRAPCRAVHRHLDLELARRGGG